MARCEVCGNDYHKPLSVTVAGGPAHTFGHGVERDGRIFCCEHCARHA